MKTEKPINKVTTTNLDIALRMCSIEINEIILDKIIDLVELLEDKGNEVTIQDICKLQTAWRGLADINIFK